MSFRKWIGKITSPIFVPLRKMVSWSDETFGTCDHRLVVVPRDASAKVGESDGLERKVKTEQISMLEKKISKDKANIEGLGTKKKSELLCYFCRSELIWMGDNTFEEYGISSEGEVVNLRCSKCPAHFEGFLRTWPVYE